MDDLGRFLVELGLLLLLLGVLGTVARRLGLSPVPLFLLGGLFLGQGGLLDIDATAHFVEAGAEIGVLLLLLLLGLEFSATEFSSSLKQHAPSGLVDFVLNAPPGYVAGVLLGLDWQACLAMAGITWISSSGIVARLIGDLRRTGNRETPAVLSVLVLEDMAMAVYLPVLAVLLAGGTAGRAVIGAVLAVGVVLAMLVAAHRYGHRLGQVLGHEDDEQVLLRVLGLTLLVAGLTHWVGASAAVGAFLVGLAIPEETARRARAVLAPLRDLFAAVFFLSFGLSVAPAEVLPVLPAAFALAAVTALTKVMTGWYAARRDGVGTPGRVRAGTALVARGEFSVVIAGLAVVAGHERIGSFASAYILLLAVAGPVLARASDGMVALGRRSRRARGASAADPHGDVTADVVPGTAVGTVVGTGVAVEVVAGAEAEHVVVAGASEEPVATLVAVEVVVVGPAVEPVLAGKAEQPVLTRSAEGPVVAVSPVQPVVAVRAAEPVVTVVAVHLVVAVAPGDPVVAVVAVDDVLAPAAADDVVAAHPPDDVVAGAALQDVVARGALDEHPRRRAVGLRAATRRGGAGRGRSERDDETTGAHQCCHADPDHDVSPSVMVAARWWVGDGAAPLDRTALITRSA